MSATSRCHDSISAALSISNRPVPITFDNGTTELTEVNSSALGLSILTKALMYLTCDGRAMSVLLRIITSANSIWSTIKLTKVRSSSSGISGPLPWASPFSPRRTRLYSPSFTVTTDDMVWSKLAASMTVTHVSSRAKLASAPRASLGSSSDGSESPASDGLDSTTSDGLESPFSSGLPSPSLAPTDSITMSMGTGMVNVSATCMGSEMPVLSMIR
mmetsp:Transcript_36235/g.88511  ORF Transcript_36235/g.88511 Transcript_36235/m.88511 type:complete len:216 (-) Transcript_36235:462-1109(-)